MKLKSVPLLVVAMLVVLASIQPASACNQEWDDIDGFVTYCNDNAAVGLIVKVYRVSTGQLEGQGSGGQPGTDETDSNGYYWIGYLYAMNETYRVEVWSSDGLRLLASVEINVPCGGTSHDFKLPCPPEGLTPGYWKNHLEDWVYYAPGTEINETFYLDSIDGLHGDTLLEALSYKGGRGIEGAARILLRAAVAAILNAAHPDVNYPLTEQDIIDAVNEALASHDRCEMLELAEELDAYNNLGCT